MQIEIRSIIQSVPPVVFPLNETLKRILDVDYREGKEVRPNVPQLGNDIRNAEDYQRQKKDNDSYEKYVQNPEGERLDDNKSNKPISQKGDQKSDNKSNKSNSKQQDQKSQNKSNNPPPSQDNVSNREGSQNQNRGGKLKKDPNVSNKDTSQFK